MVIISEPFSFSGSSDALPGDKFSSSVQQIIYGQGSHLPGFPRTLEAKYNIDMPICDILCNSARFVLDYY